MAKFINTSATTYCLEEIIKDAKEYLILISPYLQFNDRIKELLEDQNRAEIDIQVVYGKDELKPVEHKWLASQEFITVNYCKNLHAKCYLNESAGILTSMNLYEFSQVNNHEMGIYFTKEVMDKLYSDTFDEVQRIIRHSEQQELTKKTNKKKEPKKSKEPSSEDEKAKISTFRIAKIHGVTTKELNEKLLEAGYLIEKDGKLDLTHVGKDAGGEKKFSPKAGIYFIWPKEMAMPKSDEVGKGYEGPGFIQFLLGKR